MKKVGCHVLTNEGHYLKTRLQTIFNKHADFFVLNLCSSLLCKKRINEGVRRSCN